MVIRYNVVSAALAIVLLSSLLIVRDADAQVYYTPTYYIDDNEQADKLYETNFEPGNASSDGTAPVVSGFPDGWEFGSDSDEVDGFESVESNTTYSYNGRTCRHPIGMAGRHFLASGKGGEICVNRNVEELNTEDQRAWMPARVTSAARFDMNGWLFMQSVDPQDRGNALDISDYDKFVVEFAVMVFGGNFRVMYDGGPEFSNRQVDMLLYNGREYHPHSSIQRSLGLDLMTNQYSDYNAIQSWSGRESEMIEDKGYWATVLVEIDAETVQNSIEAGEGSGIHFVHSSGRTGLTAYIDNFVLYGVRSDNSGNQEESGGWGNWGGFE